MEISTNLLIYALIGFIIGMIIMRFINKNKSIGLLNDAKKEAEKLSNLQMKKGIILKIIKLFRQKKNSWN